jgi:hypothetical protein
MRFDPKISALEEREDLNSISMDELHGILRSYKRKTEQENPYVKESSLKASKKSKKKNIAATVMSQKMMKKPPTLSEY